MSYGTSGSSKDRRNRRSSLVVLTTCIALSAIAAGCNDNKPAGGNAPAKVSSASPAKTSTTAEASASAASSTASAASASSSAPAASASAAQAPSPPAEPIGPGVSGFVVATQTDTCKPQTGQVADYLQRGEVSLAGRDGAVAAAWLIKLSPSRPDAQLAFAGFSLDAKQVARARGIGTSNEIAPRLFTSDTGWTLVWFDSEGLAYTKPKWETAPLTIEHLRAVGSADAEHVALGGTPGGSIIAVAPFVADKTQLGMFSFAPVDAGSPPVQALGATHYGKKPRLPAVTADERGYTLAWHEDGDEIVVSRFDLNGKELGEAMLIAPPGAARGRVVLVSTTKGAIAVWSEGDKLFSRALDQDARPAPETYIIGYGKNPSLATLGDGAIVVFTGQDGTATNQVLAVKLAANAAPSPKGIRLTDSGPVKEPPAMVAVGARVAFLWTEPMQQGVGTKRALLRTIEAACIP